jgi:glycosyltransferase involved in cell wall biosynthesis
VDAAAPTVTCIIPAREGDEYLRAALESVLAQLGPAPEVLVVHDDSTDHVAEMVDEFGPPVRELTQRGKGPGAARRQGADEARGDFVCFLDSDDLYHPDKQRRQLERFAARPELEISLCMAEMFWEEGLGDEERRYRAIGRHRGAHLFQTLMTRRETFEKVGPINPDFFYGDHMDWLLRAEDAGAVLEILDETLVYRRMHARSLTHVSPGLESYVDVVKAHLDRHRVAEPGSA